VITEAGTHDNVTALVYIAAFAPDKGESVNTSSPPAARRPGAADPPTSPTHAATSTTDKMLSPSTA